MEAKRKEAVERRSFVRIDDDIILKYRKLGHLNLAALDEENLPSDSDSFTIKAKFSAINQQLLPVRRRLEQRSDDLATYLKSIDEKLELLADLAFQKDHDPRNQPTQKVSLSASGTSFLAQKPLELGTQLELWLLLLPSHTGIITLAKVVYCKRSEDNENSQYPYRVGVEFMDIHEEDADLIISHILKKEADGRRKRSRMRSK